MDEQMDEMDLAIIQDFLSGETLFHICTKHDLLLVDVESLLRDYIAVNTTLEMMLRDCKPPMPGKAPGEP